MADTNAVFELNLDGRLDDELDLSAEYIDTEDIDRRAGPAQLDPEELLKVTEEADPAAYGKRLTAAVFGNEQIRELFVRARDETIGAGQPLRVRLVIGDRAPRLHALDWERLRSPDEDEPLFRGGGMWFSRFLNSLDWRRAPSAAPRDPSALIAIANPTDLADYSDPVAGTPQKIDVEAELARAQQALITWRKTDRELAGEHPTTLDALIEKLRDRPDVLYLMCHGLAKADKAVLLLEKPDRTTDLVRASDLVDRLTELGHKPRLVVLASCQSAGNGEDLPDPGSRVRWRLGPELCRAGVPAVLAMQGNLTQETAEKFLPKFFEGAAKHGHLDQAMTEARFTVRDRPDWSVPTLFMRLRSGRLWARATPDRQFEKWPALITAIEDGMCVPVLGAGASDVILGTARDISQALAAEQGFPLAAYQADDFPQVSHYVQVRQGRSVLRNEVLRLFGKSLHERYGHLFDEEQDDDLDAQLAAVGKHLAENAITEPHEVVARLPFPLYITAEPTDLLSLAIDEVEGRTPVRAYFRWRESDPTDLEQPVPIDWPEDDLFHDPGYSATDPDHPVVYHLFGRVGIDWSVALTEDDFFEFLIGVDSQKESPLHPVVTKALTNHAILFMGFGVEDWSFRVLLRTIARLKGRRTLDVPHIAVQLDPDEDRTLAPDRARAYLTDFLGKADMEIYWGSTELFAHELAEKAEERGIAIERST